MVEVGARLIDIRVRGDEVRGTLTRLRALVDGVVAKTFSGVAAAVVLLTGKTADRAD